jgi:DNA-binding response OmpR family regulator
VVAGSVTIDRLRREVTVDGTPQTLTNTEFQLLSLLSVRQGEAVSREELMLEVWGTAVLGRTGRWTSSVVPVTMGTPEQWGPTQYTAT